MSQWKFDGYLVRDSNNRTVCTPFNPEHGNIIAESIEAVAILKDILAMVEVGDVALDNETVTAIQGVVKRAMAPTRPAGRYEGGSLTGSGGRVTRVRDGQREINVPSWESAYGGTRPYRRDEDWDDGYTSTYSSRSYGGSSRPKPKDDGPMDPDAMMAKAVTKKAKG